MLERDFLAHVRSQREVEDVRKQLRHPVAAAVAELGDDQRLAAADDRPGGARGRARTVVHEGAT